MARNSKVQKKTKPAEAKGRARRGRPKVCFFCTEHVEWVDYKDIALLRRFVNDRGRIKARGATGTCAQHQRDVAVAVKTARELILLPYVVRTLAPDKGDRRGGGGRRGRPADEEATTEPAGAEAAAGEAEVDVEESASGDDE